MRIVSKYGFFSVLFSTKLSDEIDSAIRFFDSSLFQLNFGMFSNRKLCFCLLFLFSKSRLFVVQKSRAWVHRVCFVWVFLFLLESDGTCCICVKEWVYLLLELKLIESFCCAIAGWEWGRFYCDRTNFLLVHSFTIGYFAFHLTTTTCSRVVPFSSNLLLNC